MSDNLPINKSDDFVGEFEEMNLDELRDKMFVVSISTDDREKSKFICTTMHGPYSFLEMVEEVGHMWENHQHHAKVTVLEKDRNKPIKWIDKNTVDYIEAKYQDIIMEGLLDGSIDEKEYTCKAGINVADDEDDPRHIKKENSNEQDG